MNLLSLLLKQQVNTRIDWKDFFEHPFIKSDSKSYSEYYQNEMAVKNSPKSPPVVIKPQPKQQLSPEVASPKVVDVKPKLSPR
jgi:hypothetical protein